MATAKEVLGQLAALAGENEAVLGSNNTTVNKYFNAVGQPYCGYAIWYAVKKAGSNILDGCGNPAYVPTMKSYLEGKGWRVANDQAQAGDIFIYSDQHMGFVYEPVSGSTVITLEGNNTAVKKTAAEAKNGTGTAYEGIGYRKRVLTSEYTVYRPAYDGTDGSGGTETGEEQVKTWQTWLGVDADGEAGPLTMEAAAKKTLQAMLAKYPLKQGMTGDAVHVAQGLLYVAGYDPKGLDGIYGSGTAAAVKAYQTANGLTADGEAGADTFAKLLGWS